MMNFASAVCSGLDCAPLIMAILLPIAGIGIVIYIVGIIVITFTGAIAKQSEQTKSRSLKEFHQAFLLMIILSAIGLLFYFLILQRL